MCVPASWRGPLRALFALVLPVAVVLLGACTTAAPTPEADPTRSGDAGDRSSGGTEEPRAARPHLRRDDGATRARSATERREAALDAPLGPALALLAAKRRDELRARARDGARSPEETEAYVRACATTERGALPAEAALEPTTAERIAAARADVRFAGLALALAPDEVESYAVAATRTERDAPARGDEDRRATRRRFLALGFDAEDVEALVTGQRLVRVPRPHEHARVAVALPDEGGRALLGTSDGLLLRDASGGAKPRRLLRKVGPARVAILSPDGRSALVSGIQSIPEERAGSAWLIDLETGRVAKAPPFHEDTVVAGAFNFDGTKVATASLDGVVAVWTVSGGALGSPTPLVRGGPPALALAFAGRDLLFAGRADGTIQAWRPTRPGGELWHLTGRSTRPVLALAASADGKSLVAGRLDGLVELWSLAGARPELRVLGYDGGAVTSARFLDASGRLVATASWAGTICFWHRSVADRSIGVVNLAPLSGRPPEAFVPTDPAFVPTWASFVVSGSRELTVAVADATGEATIHRVAIPDEVARERER